MFKNFILPALAIFCILANLSGQTLTTDSLQKRIAVLEKDLSGIKNIKLTGYVQAQWQLADTAGIKSIAGGNFPATSNNRFMIRRGRLRFEFAQKNFMLVVQPELNERLVSIRDFFGSITDPWKGHFTLTAGLFFRPFLFELPMPSFLRESPERARVSQFLVPDERDVGAKLGWKKKDLKIEIALINGNGTSGENDSKKDLLGRVSYANALKIKQLSLGASFYSGFVRQNTPYSFKFDETRGGMILKDTVGSLGAFSRRKYVAVDGQFTGKSRAGKTTIRVEYLIGTQPGTLNSSESARTNAGLVGDIYTRSVTGGIFYFVQNLGKSHFQTVFKYDFFDENSKVKGNEIGAPGSKLTAADLRYDTYGFGLHYFYKNAIFTAYYDLIKNETSTNLATHKNDLKDNVFTFRTQLKF